MAVTFRALVGKDGALIVVNIHRGAVVVAEVKLGQIAVKVLLVAVPVDAPHATPEHREEPLGRLARADYAGNGEVVKAY